MDSEQSWRVRVAGNEVFVRKHQFSIGAGLSFDLEYPAVTALEHVLAAFGSELANGIRDLARKKRIEVDQVEATVEAWLENPLVTLGVVGETGSPRIRKLRARLYISSLAQEGDIGSVWATVLERSVLVATLRGSVELDLSHRQVF